MAAVPDLKNRCGLWTLKRHRLRPHADPDSCRHRKPHARCVWRMWNRNCRGWSDVAPGVGCGCDAHWGLESQLALSTECISATSCRGASRRNSASRRSTARGIWAPHSGEGSMAEGDSQGCLAVFKTSYKSKHALIICKQADVHGYTGGPSMKQRV